MNKHSIGEKDGAEAPSHKRSKVELPTKDEQKQLQQVDLLMKSNLLQLEIEQLLNEVSGTGALSKKKVNEWVTRVTDLVKSSEDIVGNTINEATIKDLGLKDVKGIALVNSGDESMNLQFEAPASVDLIGSSVHHTALVAMLNIDVAVTMPSGLFDNRYVLQYCALFHHSACDT